MPSIRPLKIWMVSPEMHRIKKSGGMADAVYGLSEGLVKQGHKVTVVMPKHAGTLEFFLRNHFRSLDHFTTLEVKMGDQKVEGEVYRAFLKQGKRRRLNLFFIDTEDCSHFGNRTQLYGYKDDPYRFFFFNMAVYQLYHKINKLAEGQPSLKMFIPDIVHGHDWQSGFIPLFLRQYPNSAHLPFIYNIHNLGYGFDSRLSLGEFSFLLNLPFKQDPAFYSWDKGIEFHGKVDAHKAAIMFSNKIVTVSPHYVDEILSGYTPYPASLYQGILETRRPDVHGILNGLPESFTPQYFYDKKIIPANFSKNDLNGRIINREALQKKAGLPIDKDAMIVTWTSRLAGQKGIDVALESIRDMILENPKLQFIFIADGEPEFVNKLRALRREFPNQLKHLKFSEKLEILALAGGDVLLMPSLYEPCGLNQMKAQLFGTVPLVHETGGLIDTVEYGKTGFSFYNLNSTNLTNKMKNVWEAFQNKESWETIQRAIMSLDYTWPTQANKYVELYREVLESQP
ncbi:MAG: glycogen synthase [Candidatus Saganbacteria bacterium]|nr:glycogen synthase [Candidatus Saganbacteria bacterium]